MKIAIVGGGFTGLSSAWNLVQSKENEVTVFESEQIVGGLANGFELDKDSWKLERYYHHIFTNDKEAIELANQVGCKIKRYSPKTSSFINGEILRLDSPISVLNFYPISLWGRLRMGLGLGVLKLLPDGSFLERYRVVDLLPKIIGREGYEIVWRKLMEDKFGRYVKEVNMAWFWARVYKRTQKLIYFDGGFQRFAEKITRSIKKSGGTIERAAIEKIESKNGKVVLRYKEGNNRYSKIFDKVIMTTPLPISEKLTGLKLQKKKIDYLFGQTVVMELKHKLMKDYWLNILERDWPFLVVVEHTNLVNRKNYGGRILIYMGNYLESGDKRLKISDKQLVNLYVPYLKKINKNFSEKWIKKIWRFKSDHSQPVFPINYSKNIPKYETGLKNIYVANMAMVYPWDRGVNYAIDLGNKIAKIVENDK